MPKLKPVRFGSYDVRIKFNLKEAELEEFNFESQVSVDSSGIFHFTIPEKLEDTAGRMARKSEWDEKDVSFKGFGRSGRVGVACRQMRDGENFIKAVMREVLTRKVEVERVIVYGTDFDIHFWKLEDGTILPSGHSADSGKWVALEGDDNFRDGPTQHYRVGFSAAVFDKKTYTSPSGHKTIEYDRPKSFHDEEEDTPGARLNSFVRLHPDPEEKGFKEMPYTDEAATFFYSVMIGMCQLADRINSFFADPLRVEHAIKNQTPLLAFQGEEKKRGKS